MAEREGSEEQRPTQTPAGRQQRTAESRPQGDSASHRPHRPHPKSVDEKIERESVVGGHGHGGVDDLEVEEIEQESKR